MVTDTKYTDSKELRRNPRIETSNIVDYTIYDDHGNAIGQGRGETINLSQNGILLKTREPLSGVFVMLMTIDLDGNSVKVEGKLIYSTLEVETEHYLSGIEFIGPKDKQLNAIVAFVKAYNRRKHVDKKLHG